MSLKLYRIKKECGLYYIETTTDNWKTCTSVGVSTTREEAEEKLEIKRNWRVKK